MTEKLDIPTFLPQMGREPNGLAMRTLSLKLVGTWFEDVFVKSRLREVCLGKNGPHLTLILLLFYRTRKVITYSTMLFYIKFYS